MSMTPHIALSTDELALLFAEAESEAEFSEDVINESSEDYTYIFGRSHLVQ